MRSKISLFKITLLMAAMVGSAQALDIDENHPIKSRIMLQPTPSAIPVRKEVVLMNIKLTPQQMLSVQRYQPFTNALSRNDLPPKVDVGMNGVPVLDQGRHGTCVTFATTAAVDTLLGKGDYISQLCNLELGHYLKLKGYYMSGWNGSFGPLIIDQMLRFGTVNKDVQTTRSCAGVTEYPISDDENLGNVMSLDEYKKSSEDLISKGIWWNSILNVAERFNDDPISPFDGEKVLNKVKAYLATTQSKGALTFGVLLPVKYCSVGACGSYHAKFDTWAITDTIKNDSDPAFGGHEMVITGYDDNAVVTDNEGKTHQGLLSLRNSWGEKAGDHGNYYMTYDFFMKYVIEAQRVFLDSGNSGVSH